MEGIPIRKIFKIALPLTVPVLLGYLSVGMAYGLLVVKSGVGLWLGLLMSVIVFAGAMQFVAVQILLNPISFVQVAAMTLFVNIRHLFYGLSFIEAFKKFGWRKHYLIFGMTDETYSLLCAVADEKEVDKEQLYFAIAALNHSYWIIGTLLGALLAEIITFDTKGIEFAMTALFVVIFIEQWLVEKKHLPAITGILSAVLSIQLFGASSMVLPSMVIMFVTLLAVRGKMNGGEKNG